MIVVGCGKLKRPTPSLARDLYVGTLFRTAKAYAVVSGEPWVILSALHGVVTPDALIAPYEQRLSLRGSELRRWARLAADEIMQRRTDRKPVEILAGKSYADPLARELEDLGIESVEPLRGLSLGHRIQKLNAMWEAAVDDWKKREREGKVDG